MSALREAGPRWLVMLVLVVPLAAPAQRSLGPAPESIDLGGGVSFRGALGSRGVVGTNFLGSGDSSSGALNLGLFLRANKLLGSYFLAGLSTIGHFQLNGMEGATLGDWSPVTAHLRLMPAAAGRPPLTGFFVEMSTGITLLLASRKDEVGERSLTQPMGGFGFALGGRWQHLEFGGSLHNSFGGKAFQVSLGLYLSFFLPALPREATAPLAVSDPSPRAVMAAPLPVPPSAEAHAPAATQAPPPAARPAQEAPLPARPSAEAPLTAPTASPEAEVAATASREEPASAAAPVLSLPPTVAVLPASSLDDAQRDPRFVPAAGGRAHFRVVQWLERFPYYGISGSQCAGGGAFLLAELTEPFDGMPAGRQVVFRLLQLPRLSIGQRVRFDDLRRAGKSPEGTFVYCGSGAVE